MKTKIEEFLKDCFIGTRLNILFFIGIALLLTWMPFQYGARYLNTQVAGQVICGGLILLLLRERKESLFKYPLWAISVFWIAVLFSSFIFSVAKLASLEELMRNVLYIFLPIVVFSWAGFNNRIKLLSYTVLASGTLISGTAIVSFLINYIHTLSFEPASAPLTRTNDLGAFMLLIFPLSLSNFLYENDEPLEKAAYALAAILSSITIILTFSRGIWLSAVISVILILFLGRKILRKNLIYIGIVGVLGFIPFVLNWEKMVRRLLSLQNIFNNAENSIEWRKSLLRGTWNIFLDNPVIGTGINSFSTVYSFYQERAGYFSINPHNYYLQLLAETGVVGLFAFVVLALSIIYMSFKAFANSEKIFKGISLGLLVGIISSLMHISVDIDWSVAAIPIMFWLQVGLLMSIYRIVNFKESRFSSFNNRFNYLKRPALYLAAACLVIIPTMNYLSANYYINGVREIDANNIEGAKKLNHLAMLFSPYPSAKHNNSQAVILEKEGKLEEALKYSEKSINYDSYNYNYYETYTRIYEKLYPKDKKKPLEMLETSVMYNPYMHPRLYEEVAEFYDKKLNNQTDAIEWLKKANEHFPISQIPSYERYTPDDRYDLYNINTYLYNLSEKVQPGSGKDYKKIADYLIKTEPGANPESEDENSTPIMTIKNYWKEHGNKNPDLRKFVAPGYEIFNPPNNLPFKFDGLVRIQRDNFTAKIKYKISITNENEKKEFILVDKLMISDNGWLIYDRSKEE